MKLRYSNKTAHRFGQTVPISDIRDGEAFDWYSDSEEPYYIRIGNHLCFTDPNTTIAEVNFWPRVPYRKESKCKIFDWSPPLYNTPLNPYDDE